VRVCVTDQLPRMVRVRVLGVILSFGGSVANRRKPVLLLTIIMIRE
jgi:hypothetical protein